MIPANIPGPWAVDNTLPTHWAILNTQTGRRKVIGPVTARSTNYFDRAMAEACKRNKRAASGVDKDELIDKWRAGCGLPSVTKATGAQS